MKKKKSAKKYLWCLSQDPASIRSEIVWRICEHWIMDIFKYG